MSDLRKLLDEVTPGPWKAHEFKCSFSIFQREVKPGYQSRIADVIYWGSGNINPQNPMREDADANARLIVLAPDLAAALLKAEEALEFYGDKDLDGYDVGVTNYGLSTEVGKIIKDGGERARATLTEIRKLTGGP